MNEQEDQHAVIRGGIDNNSGQVAAGNTVIQVGAISGGTVNLQPAGTPATDDPAAAGTDPSSPLTPAEHEELMVIRRVLDDRFGEEDLRDLAFDLAVEYEDLPGATRKRKARELVVYCQRRGRLEELRRAILLRRPGAL